MHSPHPTFFLSICTVVYPQHSTADLSPRSPSPNHCLLRLTLSLQHLLLCASCCSSCHPHWNWPPHSSALCPGPPELWSQALFTLLAHSCGGPSSAEVLPLLLETCIYSSGLHLSVSRALFLSPQAACWSFELAPASLFISSGTVTSLFPDGPLFSSLPS